MPADHAISLAAYTGRGTPNEKRIPDDFGPKQSMRGFEETYRNIIDYIVRITYRIWEDREVEYIGATYTDDSLVYDDYGLQIGNRKIIDDTHHTTGAFSNIQLVADEIVWAGDDEVGFHTSHRTLIRGTNDGDSHYGPATMRDVDVLVIANCVSLENRIFLEHVCYNTSGMLLQLGLDLDEVAAGWPLPRLRDGPGTPPRGGDSAPRSVPSSPCGGASRSMASTWTASSGRISTQRGSGATTPPSPPPGPRASRAGGPATTSLSGCRPIATSSTPSPLSFRIWICGWTRSTGWGTSAKVS